MVDGSLKDVHGRSIGISRVVASEGDLHIDDVVKARVADTTPTSLRVGALSTRAASLGDVVLDSALARRHAASPTDEMLFVTGGSHAGRSLARYASAGSVLDIVMSGGSVLSL